jgi:PilZ domain
MMAQHPGQPRLMLLTLHREAAMSLLQAFARFKRTFIERRRSVREPVEIPAWVDVGDGLQPRSCTILDVSEGGARIKLSSPNELPKEFWLVLTKDRTRRRHCRMVWHSDTLAGVKYLGPVLSDFFPPKLH